VFGVELGPRQTASWPRIAAKQVLSTPPIRSPYPPLARTPNSKPAIPEGYVPTTGHAASGSAHFCRVLYGMTSKAIGIVWCRPIK
jgi:hypothetical protein